MNLLPTPSTAMDDLSETARETDLTQSGSVAGWDTSQAVRSGAAARPQPSTAAAIRAAACAGVRCVVSTTSASACSQVRAASA